MFLKRLDVVGFKSFADRINIEFVPGVTAVVGPNGSGKSNISDAVRWVLGSSRPNHFADRKWKISSLREATTESRSMWLR